MTRAAAGGAGSGRGSNALPEEAIEEIRRYYGFDKPVHIRYAQWLWNVLHLDLGTSYIYQDPVWDVIKSRFPDLDLPRPDRLLPELPRLHAARRAQGGAPRLAIRLRQQRHRVPRLLGARVGARHGAARAVRRRQLLERVPARRIPSRQLGVSERLGRRSPASCTTCSCRCSATWSARSRRRRS